MHTTRLCFLLFVGCVVSSLILGVVLIRSVDPEKHWTATSVDKYEYFRPYDEKSLKQYRFGLIKKAQPTTLLLGNSRTLYGFARENFDPHTFNASMDAAQMDQQEEYADFTLHQFPLKRLVIGTDFGMFIGRSKTVGTASAGCYYITSICHYLSAYSPSAFKGSLVTLYNAHYNIADPRYSIPADGFLPAWPSSSDQPLRIRHAYAIRIMRYAFGEGGDYEKTRQRIREQSGPQYAALDRVLAQACKSNVQIQLAILPLHADALMQFKQSGLMPEFESFKQKIVDAAARAPCHRIEVWDFGINSAYIHEPISATTKEWKWFIEPFHFRPALGTIIADVLAERRPAAKIARRLDANTQK